MSDQRQDSAPDARDPLLYGSYERALDSKGRFNVPFRFRKKDLAPEEEPPRFMVTEDPQGVVSLMTCSQYEESLERTKQLGRGRELWNFLRWLATHSQEVQMDGQGRVAVPQRYLDRIGARKRLLVLGVGDRMELWEPGRYDAVQTASGSPTEEFFEEFFQ